MSPRVGKRLAENHRISHRYRADFRSMQYLSGQLNCKTSESERDHCGSGLAREHGRSPCHPPRCRFRGMPAPKRPFLRWALPRALHQLASPNGPRSYPNLRQTAPPDAWSGLRHCHRLAPWPGSTGRNPSRYARGGEGLWEISWPCSSSLRATWPERKPLAQPLG
jgi:hypothetical protein